MRGPDSAAYVVAKAPKPGVTKTRLCPPLTPAEAAKIALAFVQDTLANVALAGIRPRIICRGPDDQRELRRLAGPKTRVSIQSGEGLGNALESAFREGVADGFAAIAVLGADSPTLPVLVIREAFAAVASGHDLVLGPADDGGYYLLAARRVHPELFREMRWSTAGVANETLHRARALGLRTHVLPGWYDVDDAVTLANLRRDLRRLPKSRAPQTRAVLSELDHAALSEKEHAA